MSDPGDLVVLDGVPHVEEVEPAGTKHPMRLAEAAGLVGEEHEPELAHDGVECAVGERQARPIRLLPVDPTGAHHDPGMRDHRLVEIGGHESAAPIEPPGQPRGDNPGATGHLQDAHPIGHGQS